jgi:hypothetical protein
LASPPTRRATIRFGPKQLSRINQAFIAIVVISLGVVLRPIYLRFLETRDSALCQANLLKISRGIQLYRGDYDDTLPLAANWQESAAGNMAATSGSGKSLESYFRCPKEKTGGATSYAYNRLVEGLSASIRQNDPEAEARRDRLGSLLRAPMVFEKHGGARNAFAELGEWSMVASTLDRPHLLESPTGWIVNGAGEVQSWSDERLQNMTGKRF